MPGGEDSLACVIGKQSFYLQFRPVFPLHQRISGIKNSVDTFGCKENSNTAGVIDFYSLSSKFLDLPGMIKDRAGDGAGSPGIWLEEMGLFVPEGHNVGGKKHGIYHGCLLETEPSGVITSWTVGVAVAGEVKGEAFRVQREQQLFSGRSKPVATELVFVVCLDVVLGFESGNQFFSIAGTDV